MVHKLALGIGALVSVGVLIGSIAIASLAAHPGRAQETATQTTADKTPLTQTKVDTVYVKPVPPAKVIHVTKKAPAPTTKPRVVTVTVTKPSRGGDDGGDREGGD